MRTYTQSKQTITLTSVNEIQSLRHNISSPQNTFSFNIPGTRIDLMLSNFHGLLNQSELDLCVIEGFGDIFGKVIAKGSDAELPLNMWSSKYGNVVINLYDFSPPAFHMTYGSVATTLRGIALFASQHGYVQMQFDVFDSKVDHLGTGEVGQILPS